MNTLVWVSSNCLYMVYHRLAVLMLYILLFIVVVDCRFRATLVVLFILTTPDLEYYPPICNIYIIDFYSYNDNMIESFAD